MNFGGFGEFRETIICAASWPEGQGAEGILQGTIKESPLDIEASLSLIICVMLSDVKLQYLT